MDTNLDFTSMDNGAKARREELFALQHAIVRLDLLREAKRREGATVGELGRVGAEILALTRVLHRLVRE